MRRILAIALALSLLALPALANLVGRFVHIVTRDGRQFDGRVLEETATDLKVEITRGGMQYEETVSRSQMVSFTLTAAPAAVPEPASPGATERATRLTAAKMLKAFSERRYLDVLGALGSFDVERRRYGAARSAETERRALSEAAAQQKLDPSCAPQAGLDFGGIAVVAARRFHRRCEVCNGRGAGSICASCAGTGKIPCAMCSGQRWLACPSCTGGRVPCLVCKGVPRTICSKCGGGGQILRPAQKTSIITFQPAEWVRCSFCAGKGHADCAACAGKGTLACTVCGGKGKSACSSCSGTGRTAFPCPMCDGKAAEPCKACGGTGERASSGGAPGPAKDSFLERLEAMRRNAEAAQAQGRTPLDDPNALADRQEKLANLRSVRDAGLMDEAEYARRATALLDGK